MCRSHDLYSYCHTQRYSTLRNGTWFTTYSVHQCPFTTYSVLFTCQWSNTCVNNVGGLSLCPSASRRLDIHCYKWVNCLYSAALIFARARHFNTYTVKWSPIYSCEDRFTLHISLSFSTTLHLCFKRHVDEMSSLSSSIVTLSSSCSLLFSCSQFLTASSTAFSEMRGNWDYKHDVSGT